MAYLILSNRETEIGRHDLADAMSVVIGRAVDVDVPVRDILLSRRHCRIARDGNRWIVTDLGSKNGTRISGQVLPPNEPQELQDGDEIRAGRTHIEFRAGRFMPAPPEVAAAQARRESARPADPIEALAGTVMGMTLTDMEDDSEKSGFPIPRPRPMETTVYTRPSVRELSRPARATAPGARGTTVAKAPAAAAAPAVVKRRVELRRSIRPPALQIVVTPKSTPARAPRPVLRPADPTRRLTIPRWLAITYIALAACVFVVALAVITAAQITAAQAR